MGSRITGVAVLAALVGALWLWVTAKRGAEAPAGGEVRIAAGLAPLGGAAGLTDPGVSAALAPSLSPVPGAPPGSLSAVGRGAAASFSPEGVTVSFAGPEGGPGAALRWSVEGARAVEPEGADRLPGVHHFFIGDDPSRWRRDVPRYGSAVYRGLRPGLDVKATPVEGGARLQVTATAEALRDTWFRWEGQRTSSAGGGGLVLETPHGAVTQTLEGPVRIAETRPSPGGAGLDYRVEATVPIPGFETFSVGLLWSGYLAGTTNDDDFLNEIHLDGAGNLFVVGQTTSPTFPVTDGSSIGGAQDAYVAKISPGGQILWATYLGGANNSENGEELAFASNGDIVVVGRTRSDDFPGTAGRYDDTLGGAADAFVARLSATGALVWGTYLGGADEEYGLAVAVDPYGNAWIAGWTGSDNFPATAGAFKSTNSGPSGTACPSGSNACEIFLSQLDPGGTSLLFSSFFGGTGIDEVYDMALSDAGALYLAGYTTSTDLFSALPSLQGSAYQGELADAGTYDGFLFKLVTAPDAGTPAYLTYLGGAWNDFIQTLAIDGSGAVLVAGRTSSPDFPGGAAVIGGPRDVFVSKFAPGLTGLAWSSLFGGSGSDQARNIAIGPDGAILVVGTTDSMDFPTSGAFDGTLGGTNDAFVARLSADGLTLDWATYLGGAGIEDGRSIDVDARGNVYVGGTTDSSDFFGDMPGSRGGLKDGFLAKIDTTPPDGGVVNDGASGDLDVQNDGASLSANWSGFADPDAPIDGYQWALGTTPGDDSVMGFQDAGLVTQATQSGLGLQDGTWYYATVRAITSAGLSAQASSDGVLVDASPPPAGAVRDGPSTTEDVEYQRPDASFSANWDSMADPHSSPTTYAFAIGTDAGTADVLGFIPVGLAQAASFPVLLSHGVRYYATVRATNDAGLSTTRSSSGVLVDATAPATGLVQDGPGADLVTQPRTSALQANWSGFADPESGIERYEWAIGTASDTADVLPFTGVGLQTSASASGLVDPQAGVTYFVTVRAFNGAGDFSLAYSDGVKVVGVLGDSCSGDTECETSLCQSSVCCASICGECQACDLTGNGQCAPVQDGTSCADILVCDGLETCQGGACVGGTPVTCTQPTDGEYLTCQDPPGSCRPASHAPEITSLAPDTADTARQYRYAVQVLGTRPLTFSLCGGPPGAAIDAAGLLSWTPAQAGTESFCVYVKNDVGETTQNFLVVVSDRPVDYGEVELRFSTDGGAPQFGARQPIAADVRNLIAMEVRDLKLVMAASGLSLASADGGASAGACDQGLTLPVAPVPANGTEQVPVVAYVCRGPGEGPAQLVGHLERADGTRLSDDATLDLDVAAGQVPVGCACSGAPGTLAVAALLWALARRRRTFSAGSP